MNGQLIKLAEIPLFAELSAAGRNMLLSDATFARVPSGEMILKAGELPDALIVLLDGLVELMDAVETFEATILLLKPVTCFITAAVLRDEPLLTSARAAQPCTIVRVPARSVRDLVAQDAGFARAIAADLSLNYRNAIRELKNMRMRTAFQRLVAWILAMRELSSTPSEVRLPYNKALLAARLGMSPETLSRDLARLGGHGVAVQGRVLKISDAMRLRQLIHRDDLCDPPVP